MKRVSQVRSLAFVCICAAGAFLSIMIGGQARAEIIFTSANFDIEVSDPVNVGTTPLKAVTLTAKGKNGYKPKTFDSTKSDYGGSGTGITTTGNELYQVGLKSNEPPLYIDVYTPTNTSNMAPTLDTHFLIDSGTYQSYYGPFENMNVVNTSDSVYGHYGDALYGTFSLNGMPVSATWNFAYLVVPDKTVVQLDFEILGPLDESHNEKANVVLSFMVPEPGAFMLLATGGIGLMLQLWRRQKS